MKFTGAYKKKRVFNVKDKIDKKRVYEANVRPSKINC